MSSVLYEIKSRVARVTLNEPEKRNPFNRTLTAALIAALERAQGDAEASVILLDARGEAFCAGGDLREFQAMRAKPSPEVYEEGKGTAELFKLLGALTKPVIAAVNGAALGGGCGLACAATIVIASDRARFGCTEIRLGLFPLVILPAVRQAVGERRALELGLTGAILGAEAARAAGIVTRVVPHDELADAAWTTAEQIAASSPIALRLGLEAFRTSTGMPLPQAIDYLNALRVVVFQTEDVEEGASAFLERRKPQWRGR